MRRNAGFTILSIIFLLLLSGCIKIEIDTGIDENLTAYLSYSIELDVSELDGRYHNSLQRALNEIGWTYQEEFDFVVSLDTESNPYVLTMTKSIRNDSLEQAYDSLEHLLTNENVTPFMQIDTAFQSTQRQNRYIFSATADIPQIMRLSNVEELPPAMKDQFEESMRTGGGSITLTLPVSELINSSHQAEMQNNQAVMVVPLSYTSQTEFELAGVVNLLRDGTPGGSLNEIIRSQYSLRNMIIFVCCVVITVLLIVMLIVNIVKSKSRNVGFEH